MMHAELKSVILGCSARLGCATTSYQGMKLSVQVIDTSPH